MLRPNLKDFWRGFEVLKRAFRQLELNPTTVPVTGKADFFLEDFEVLWSFRQLETIGCCDRNLTETWEHVCF
jgi:hypothetical protein